MAAQELLLDLPVLDLPLLDLPVLDLPPAAKVAGSQSSTRALAPTEPAEPTEPIDEPERYPSPLEPCGTARTGYGEVTPRFLAPALPRAARARHRG